MPAVISPEIHTEWITFRQFLSKQAIDSMKLQLKELATNKILDTMFPNLNALAKICLSIPVSTALVERSFSEMKMIKARLRNRLGEKAFHTCRVSLRGGGERGAFTPPPPWILSASPPWILTLFCCTAWWLMPPPSPPLNISNTLVCPPLIQCLDETLT